jgi:hypothetical protein
MSRLARDWRALTGEQRLAGAAAVALGVTMLLPWYQQNAVVNAPKTAPLQSRNLNAFQAFSFIEAAVLLVAVAAVYLLYARAEGREFHLPGSDGAVVMAAGLWTMLLLVIRLFDKPSITAHGVAANVGVQWGIFFALGAAGLLTYAGSRMRAARRPEPPLRRDHLPARHRHPPPRQPEPAAPRVGSRYPPAPGGPGAAPAQQTRPARPDTSRSAAPAQPASTQAAPPAPPAPTVKVSRAKSRAVPAHQATEQLSFEDQPPDTD